MIPVLGGLFDGCTKVRTAPAKEFVWFDGVKCWSTPGKNRQLYRKRNQRKKIVLVFVGYQYVLCQCGSYHKSGHAKCTLCGAPLKKAA